LNLSLSFQKLNAQASRDVERDMAVHEPGARVVGFEGKHEVARAGEGGGIPTNGVVCFERGDVAGPVACALSEDVEIMAVKMDRVRDWRGIWGGLDHPVLPLTI
jgi:hypothetical protein